MSQFEPYLAYEASAGSGKTFNLVVRYLSLLSAEIDWRWPGRWMTGVLPLSAQVLPCTVSARKPASSQKYTSAPVCRACAAMPG